MATANLKVINEFINFINSVNINQTLKTKYLFNPKAFTRNRKIDFSSLTFFILSLLRKSLNIEFKEAFEIMDIHKSCEFTKGAFSLRRHQVKSDWFKVLLEVFAQLFYEHAENIKTWKGYNLIALDGSTAFLLEEESVIKKYPKSKNQHSQSPVCRYMKMYDVLNNIILKATMMPMTGSERLCSYDWVESIPKQSITLIDRGFPSYTLFWLFLNSGGKDFVARCSISFNNKIKAFVSSNETSLLMTIYPDSKAIAILKKLGKIVSKNDGIKIRAEKIKLDTGEIEILLTSILEEGKISNAELKELYFKRWSIETAINYSKNIFQLERFSSHKVNGIEQDFYATLIASNIHALILAEAQKKVDEKKGEKQYDYKVNLSASTNEFKKKIHKILRGDNLEIIIIQLVKVFVSFTEPIRPNRKCERKKRSRRRNGKIQTDKNHRYNM